MANIAIYYKMNEEDKTTEVVEEINQFIELIDYEISGVYIDDVNSIDELMKLTHQDLTRINILFVNRILENDFDTKLLLELAKNFNFELKYFEEI